MSHEYRPAAELSPLAKVVTLEHFDSDTVRGIGLFVLRAAMLLLFLHGWSKFNNYDGFIGAMGNMPIGNLAPAFFGFLVVAGQLLLGIGLILGLGTRWCALLLALMFGFIIFTANIPGAIEKTGSILSDNGGVAFEASLFYFVPALALVFLGGGKFSIDRLLLGRK